MKKVILIVLLVVVICCETKKQPNPTTVFISEILSDTTEIQIITSKNALISNFDWTPTLSIIGFNDEGEAITEVRYLSELLEEKDTLYISEQLHSKNKIDFEALKREGFKIFDLCKYSSENLSHQQIRQKASEQNAGNKFEKNGDYFVMLKNPIFNKKKDKVYVRVNSLRSGTAYLFVKEKNKWTKKKLGIWAE